MRVLVTGATGLIGSAVVAELVQQGHAVLALARSDASALSATAAGAEVARGALADLDVIRAAADRVDGVIHLAFANDFQGPDQLAKAIGEEAAALKVVGEALVGSDRPLITVSGTPNAGGRPSTELDPTMTEGPVGGRGRATMAVLELASQGVRCSAVRLPRTVHNNGSGGFAGILTKIARLRGVAGYPGDGMQRWPAVHALDAARLFRIALERSEAGSIWHAVGDDGVQVRDIIEVIGRRLGLPVQPAPDETFGPLAPIFRADQPSSSAHTQSVLRWKPQHLNLLEDLENITA